MYMLLTWLVIILSLYTKCYLKIPSPTPWLSISLPCRKYVLSGRCWVVIGFCHLIICTQIIKPVVQRLGFFESLHMDAPHVTVVVSAYLFWTVIHNSDSMSVTYRKYRTLFLTKLSGKMVKWEVADNYVTSLGFLFLKTVVISTVYS